MSFKNRLDTLKSTLSGDLLFDDLTKSLYATDASVYRMLPLAVAYPRNNADIKALIAFAKENNTSLVPRTAGTSLAGQCVGEGIIVDVSRYFTEILHFDEKAKTVTVQPGVVRDSLNTYLKPHGLFFGPNTSTSNRCMIGGMVGNNSSGTTSIQYGVTRDKVLQLKTILSDGSEAIFNEVSAKTFQTKTKENNLEGKIYNTIYNALKSEKVQQHIFDNFPKSSIHRRNTGYALDALINSNVFQKGFKEFNMCRLLAGSEGTLAFTTEITLQLDELPPEYAIMVPFHFNTIESCLQAVAPAMRHNLYTCEMMDKTILDCTKNNRTQQSNRQFLEGDPKAILMCEVRAESSNEAEKLAENLIKSVTATNLSYAAPILRGEDINKAIELRKAGLGLLGNIVGDNKAVACIEDTAVDLKDLADYISEFSALMNSYHQDAVYYAHAGAGELHLRPILNLKKSEDVSLFKDITTSVAKLVKKYQGSMSGEHGDGIVRSSYIPMMIGEENYVLLKTIKAAFDPKNIFNPGKIVDAFPMDLNLRYEPDRTEPEVETFMDFSASEGILREAEKCNGSGDCRKLPEFGGTMCPSFRATRNEKDTTRARANALREFLTHSDKINRFNHEELKEVFDLCLSCKACASECPSSVDVASLKAEFQYQYHQANGVSLRTKLFAYNDIINRIGGILPGVTNAIYTNKATARLLKSAAGIAKERSLPVVSKKTLSNCFHSFKTSKSRKNYIKTVYFFNDEFTNRLDTNIGIDAIELLEALNYQVKMIDHAESGRSFISKGLLKQAKKCANRNVSVFKKLISEKIPLIGVEPSAILSFRDDYLKLADDKEGAKSLANNTFLIEEFLADEINKGNIKQDQFTNEVKTIKFHGHCHQKALSSVIPSFSVLNLPKNYKVTIIPSGCCGMAGSFGYEKEHHAISMAIGEQTLFPAVRKAGAETIVVANGTSCRHQIADGTGKKALHPVTVLRAALA